MTTATPYAPGPEFQPPVPPTFELPDDYFEDENTVTLTGYLGRDREIKATRTRTFEVPEREHFGDDDFSFLLPPREVTAGGHEFVVLSLATHERVDGKWTTRWHRLVAWNTERPALHPARLCRKGDKVRITGRRDSFTYERDGETHTIHQIVLDDLTILKTKAPEVA